MTPAEVARGMLDTFDVAVYLVGFLTVVGLVGGFLDLRLGKKWRQISRDLRETRWKKLYR